MPNVVLNGTVPYSSNVLSLGLTIDGDLSFKAHANEISSKVFARLRSL